MPDQLAAATTTNDGANLVTSWPATTSDRGAGVTEYRIKFQKDDGTFVEISECPGTDSTVVYNRECTVAMTIFTSSPFDLDIDDLIAATVEAKNDKGYSGASDPNASGAQAETEPTVGPQASRGVGTSSTALEVTWEEVTGSTNTGGADLTYYYVYWDAGNGGTSDTWVQVVSTDADTNRAVTTNAVVTGTTYQFGIKAVNVHGEGPLGGSLSIVAAATPGAPTTLV